MKTVLTIYKAPNGQWSGRVTEITMTSHGKTETVTVSVAGCNSPEEAAEAIYDTGIDPDEIHVQD